jgi:ketosteroid isomerase-like protein
VAHPNEELLRNGYDAFGKGDMETIRSLFADDIVWHSPGKSPLAGDYRGVDAVLEQFGRLFELTGGTFKIEIHDILANDTHAVVLARATAERDGKRLDDKGVNVWHLKDGKVTEQWLHPGDQYASDEFFSD